MQLRVCGVGQIGGGSCGQLGFPGAVGGHKDLCGEDTHWANLLALRPSLGTIMPRSELRRLRPQVINLSCVEGILRSTVRRAPAGRYRRAWRRSASHAAKGVVPFVSGSADECRILRSLPTLMLSFLPEPSQLCLGMLQPSLHPQLYLVAHRPEPLQHRVVG